MSTHPIMIDFFSNHLLFRHIFKLGDNVKKGDIVGHDKYVYICKTWEVNEVTEDNLNDVSMFDKKGDGKGYINLGYKPYVHVLNSYENFTVIPSYMDYMKLMYEGGFIHEKYDASWTRDNIYAYELDGRMLMKSMGEIKDINDYDIPYENIMLRFDGDDPEITSSFLTPDTASGKLIFNRDVIRKRYYYNSDRYKQTLVCTINPETKVLYEQTITDILINTETLQPNLEKLYQLNDKMVKKTLVEYFTPGHLLYDYGNHYCGAELGKNEEKGITYGFYQRRLIDNNRYSNGDYISDDAIPVISVVGGFPMKRTDWLNDSRILTPQIANTPINMVTEVDFWSYTKTSTNTSSSGERSETTNYYNGYTVDLLFNNEYLGRIIRQASNNYLGSFISGTSSQHDSKPDPVDYFKSRYLHIWNTYIPDPEGNVIDYFNLSITNNHGYWLKLTNDGIYDIEMDIYFSQSDIWIWDGYTFGGPLMTPNTSSIQIPNNYLYSSSRGRGWTKGGKITFRVEKNQNNIVIKNITAPNSPINNTNYNGRRRNFTELNAIYLQGDKIFINAIKATYGYDDKTGGGEYNKWDFLFVAPPFTIKKFEGTNSQVIDNNDIDHMTYING